MSGLMGKGMAGSQTRLNALKLQSSAYGVTIPVVYGQTRVAPNLIWYGNFISNQQGGGKGGNGGKAGGSYTYTAAVMFGICEGPITGVSEIWVGQAQYLGGYTPGNLASSSQNFNVPAGGGTVTVINAAHFASTVSVTLPTGAGLDGTATRYLAQGADYYQAGGTFTFPAGSPAAGGTVTIVYQWVVSLPSNPPLTQLGLSMAPGDLGQSTWSWLQSFNPGQALGYSGVAYAYASNYNLDTTASLQLHSFEVVGLLAGSVNSSTPDVDPSACAVDLLTNARYGAGFPPQWIASITPWSTYCKANGLLLSPAFTEQKKASALLSTLAALTNTEVVWSEGALKMVPFGDTAVSGNGVTYTPNVTPIYDLDYDHFVAGGEPPIMVTRKGQADIYNHVRVEYWNRSNAYNVEIAEAKEFGSIQKYLLRTAPTITAHEVCDPQVARTVAQLALQRSVYIRAQYQFKLPVNFSLLEPMDIVTLTDATLGFSRLPVRIIQIDEDDSEELTITAEDFPIGAAHAAIYTPQAGLGFAHNFNATPGSVSAVQFFEPPTELSTSGLEVWAAVRGPNATWGGCHVHVSTDGTNYRTVATINGPSRFGTLSGPIAAGALPVLIPQGQLNSGSASDAAALATLVWIGGANTEYLAYQTATLTGAGAYTLTGLAQGAYGSTPAAHTAGDPFVRVDGQVAKSGPLTLDFIGRTLQFKFTSFNLYGGGEESIDSVAPYAYTVTGVMTKLPPAPPTGVVANFETSGIRIVWVPSTSGDVATYEVRTGASWGAGTLVGRANADHYYWQVQPAAIYPLWVAALDPFGNYSTPVAATANVTAPGAVSNLSTQVVDNNVLFFWTAPTTGSLAIKGYQFRRGATWAGASIIGDNGSSTFFTYFEQAGGSFTYWIAPIDLAGNIGTPKSTSATVQNPPDYVLHADLFSNFAARGSYLSATPTNALIEAGALWAPVDTATTWSSHFTANSWASPQAQVTAGFPLYLEPSPTTASYEEIIDYGSLLPATTIVVTPTILTIAGTVTVTPTISWSNDNVTYTAGGVGQYGVLAPGFRYVKVHLDFAGVGGANLIEITSLETKLSIKQRRDGGSGTATATGTHTAVNSTTGHGDLVLFSYPFISANPPTVTAVPPLAAANLPWTAVIDYLSVPDPLGFGVLIYDRTGVRQSCPFTWNETGY